MKRIKTRALSIFCALTILAGCLLPGTYTKVSAADKTIPQVTSDPDDEMRAAWIAYYDFTPSKYKTEKEFCEFVDNMFDSCVDAGMNTVIVHVRPFCDAMYESLYYPWSVYSSGTQGKNPGYDPLEVMTYEAHQRGLQIHAWLNPYRVTSSGTDVTKLAKTNPARKWLTNKKKSDDRNVLAYGGKLYLNPARTDVQNLIVNGVKEIVRYYDVDGIHFDDYFYPAFPMDSYETVFDAPEYLDYVAKCEKKGTTPKDINHWRRDNVNKLIKKVYAAVKDLDPNVTFGISPGGYIDYFDDVNRWYVDYRTWMGKAGYIDYICPQLYWSFSSLNIYPYRDVLKKWAKVKRHSSVKLYVGLPMYKMNDKNYTIDSSNKILDAEWFDYETIARMVEYGRTVSGVSGFFFFDYKNLVDSKNKAAVQSIKEKWD